MARYGNEFKARAVARLLPPESAPIPRVSQETGVSVATLERAWTAAARLEAVIATAAMDEAQRSAWCREQGLFPADLQQWRQSAMAALSQPEEARASPQETREDRRRIKELERDLRRKEKRHAGQDRAILSRRHALYTEARAANPRRWARHTRNWQPVAAVTLNPERESVVNAACNSARGTRRSS